MRKHSIVVCACIVMWVSFLCVIYLLNCNYVMLLLLASNYVIHIENVLGSQSAQISTSRSIAICLNIGVTYSITWTKQHIWCLLEYYSKVHWEAVTYSITSRPIYQGSCIWKLVRPSNVVQMFANAHRHPQERSRRRQQGRRPRRSGRPRRRPRRSVIVIHTITGSTHAV